MKDHRAPKATITLGVTESEYKGFVPMTTGVVPGSQDGALVRKELGQEQGIPMENYTVKHKLGAHGCRGNDGTCTAYPQKGTAFCYGHGRSRP